MSNIELGDIIFNTNKHQSKSCPLYVIFNLKKLRNTLDIKMKRNTPYYDNPFDNTGNTFKNDTFEVQAYNWDDNVEQEYNFKYKDIKVSWYKYLGRGVTINRDVTEQEAKDMLKNCIISLN